jgi:hypothetical protein
MLPGTFHELCRPWYTYALIFTEDGRQQFSGWWKCLGVMLDKEADKVIDVFESLICALPKVLSKIL